jgi:hypothetical protein
MAEINILTEDDQVELINGGLFDMEEIKPRLVVPVIIDWQGLFSY